MNTVYRYFRIWALMVLSTQLVVGMDPDTAGEVLCNAARLNNIDNVRAALDAGANVNVQNRFGCTALMEAVWYNRPLEIVNALIAAGADVNVQNRLGCTALMEAVWYNRSIEIVNALIAAGTDVNVQDQNGCTALMWAVMNNRPEIVNALIAVGADVNVQDQNGDTALMEAVAPNKSIEIVNALIAAGANVNVVSLDGRTPLIIARRHIRTLMNLLQALCDNGRLYDQLYAISEDQDAVIAEVRSIIRQVEQQAHESEQKQRILQELQGYLGSYDVILK